MTLTELLTQGDPRIIALDQWQYQGEATLLRVVALADHQLKHRATAVFDPESLLVLAVEVFADQDTQHWREIAFTADLEGRAIDFTQCLELINTLCVNNAEAE